MIEDELRAAFARHEYLTPSERELAPRVAETVRRRRSRRAAVRASSAALAVAAVAAVPMLVGSGGPVGQGGQHSPTGRPGDPTPTAPTATSARNLLVVGSDERPDLPGSGRADAIVLVHLAPDGRRAYLVSLPRDTLMPGDCGSGQPGRLFCPFLRGGPAAEADAVSRLTGVHVDRVVSVRFAGLVAVVDALGGVDLTVDQPVRSFDTHRLFRPGRRHFTGAQALDYVRQRHDLANGDLDRERHQQQLLAALVARATGQGVLTNPVRLAQVLHAGGDAVSVTPAGVDLARLARQYAKVRAGSLVGLTVPGHPGTHGSSTNPVATYDLDPGASALFAAVAADRLAPFVRDHPELVWRIIG